LEGSRRPRLPLDMYLLLLTTTSSRNLTLVTTMWAGTSWTRKLMVIRIMSQRSSLDPVSAASHLAAGPTPRKKMIWMMIMARMSMYASAMVLLTALLDFLVASDILA